MKHFPILRLFAFGVILLTAMAFSCEDHNIPDPVANCNRVDGTPRAFDCEFEFVKALIYDTYYVPGRVNDTVYYGTITPDSPDVEIKEPYHQAWLISSITGISGATVKIKVTIKRIAPPPSPTAINYLVRRNLIVNPNDNLDEYAAWYISPDSLNFSEQKIDIPLGATGTFNTTYSFIGFDSRFGANEGHLNLMPILNKKTANTLAQAPYNYTLFRDLAETTVSFRPKFIPAPYL